ncbi:hypothetical protein [Dysgonomonas termitidis]|uniref:YfhD family protein n=1 Tax=Dysgonomonas termitidis TaxID=1516126 RepID=A0ABV9L1A5_9BACT
MDKNNNPEYLNEFHKEQTEQGLNQVAAWAENPMTFEQKLEQQKMLDEQRARREANGNS